MKCSGAIFRPLFICPVILHCIVQRKIMYLLEKTGTNYRLWERLSYTVWLSDNILECHTLQVACFHESVFTDTVIVRCTVFHGFVRAHIERLGLRHHTARNSYGADHWSPFMKPCRHKIRSSFFFDRTSTSGGTSKACEAALFPSYSAVRVTLGLKRLAMKWLFSISQW